MFRSRIRQFGVSLITPVDFYLLSERSIKHGLLLIVLSAANRFFCRRMTAASRCACNSRKS